MSIFEKIGFSELTQLINELPPELHSKLNEAHNRYEHLIGITAGEFSEETISKDRKEYAEFIKTNESDLANFNDDDCSLFMSKKYDLPVLLCRIFITNDFNWTIASGFAETSIEENCAYLKKYILDDNLLKETVDYLLQCATTETV
jgi:hypothetical protein